VPRRYVRLDGSTNRVQRMIDINRFNRPGSDLFIYILNTRAGAPPGRPAARAVRSVRAAGCRSACAIARVSSGGQLGDGLHLVGASDCRKPE